jgi:hypothetical protein
MAAATGGAVTPALGATGALVGKRIWKDIDKTRKEDNPTQILSQETLWQFQHKYHYGANKPLSLEVSFNQTRLNQFIQLRQLKGKAAFDIYNTKHLGDYLNAKGFFQSLIIS